MCRRSSKHIVKVGCSHLLPSFLTWNSRVISFWGAFFCSLALRGSHRGLPLYRHPAHPARGVRTQMEQELVRASMGSCQENSLVDSESAHSTSPTKALSECPGGESLPATGTVFAGILPSLSLFGFVHLLLPHLACRFFLPFFLLLHFFSPFGSFSLPSLIWALSQPAV